VLLHGTLVAQLGYILGLLVTGGTVNNTALIKDDDSGEPQTGKEEKTRVPIIGTVIVALLPMIGCAISIYWVSRIFGSDILEGMQQISVHHLVLPTSLPLLFVMLREVIGLVEHLVTVIFSSNLTDWRTLLFLYLVICLTVRMAPLTGNLRGSLGAIFLAGTIAFLIGQITKSDVGPLSSAWPLITFSVATLLFLLVISLIVQGTVVLIKTLFGEG